MEAHPSPPIIIVCAIKVWWLANMVCCHHLHHRWLNLGNERWIGFDTT
jgi:hypothetical protein